MDDKIIKIATIKEFKELTNKEKAKDNIDNIYFRVCFLDDEIGSTQTINQALEVIKIDYDNISFKNGFSLNDYTISVVLITKDESYQYIYYYDMEVLRGLI